MEIYRSRSFLPVQRGPAGSGKPEVLAAAETTATKPAVRVPLDIQQLLQHRGHALLIGVSDYKSSWPQLPNVKNDLQDLKAGLEPYFETVDTMQNPTVAQLRDRMGEFLLGQWNNPNERLFIYYAGHGFTAFNQSSRQNDGYITGSDTPGKAVAKAVSLYDVDSWSRQTSARHVLMVFDACFSGSLFETMGPPEEPARTDRGPENARSANAILYYRRRCSCAACAVELISIAWGSSRLMIWGTISITKFPNTARGYKRRSIKA